jgi:hypothetical protein
VAVIRKRSFRRKGLSRYRFNMSDTPKGKSASTGRDDRRARALRENLKRRKAQARGRAKLEQVEKPLSGRDSGKDFNSSDKPGKE